MKFAAIGSEDFVAATKPRLSSGAAGEDAAHKMIGGNIGADAVVFDRRLTLGSREDRGQAVILRFALV